MVRLRRYLLLVLGVFLCTPFLMHRLIFADVGNLAMMVFLILAVLGICIVAHWVNTHMLKRFETQSAVMRYVRGWLGISGFFLVSLALLAAHEVLTGRESDFEFTWQTGLFLLCVTIVLPLVPTKKDDDK